MSPSSSRYVRADFGSNERSRMSTVSVGIDLTALIGAPSGIHQATKNLVSELSEVADLEIRGWLLTSRGAPPDTSVALRRSRIPARVAHRLWQHKRTWLDRIITGPVDVVHGPNFTAPPTTRSVITVQDLCLLRYPQWCRPEVVAMAKPLRTAIGAGATVHVTSKAIAEEVHTYFDLPDNQVVVVPHGVEAIANADPDYGCRLAGYERYVLILGTVEHRKNVAAVADSLHMFPDDVGLVVAGPTGNAESTLRGAAADPRFVRLTEVNDTQRAALLRGATVLAYPSRYEGFALPPLEALSVGTPVVANAVGALPELIGDQLELATNNDHQAFTEQLRAAIAAPPTVPHDLIARIQKMTWRKTAQQMAELYRSIK